MPHIKYLNNFIDKTIDNLENFRKSGVKSEFSFNLESSDLEDYNSIDIRKSPKFEELFKELQNINGPVLYWIEIVSDIQNNLVIDSLQKYKETKNPKATPAIKKGINYNTKVLYVGKVKGIFWGRVIQHMGYFKNTQTQGLQLYYWTTHLPLILQFHVLEFELEMANLMSVIEYAFAQELKPLIGKHK
ncbi:hypothetical protein [Edaphocola flava]|uniref:hypothetical protein n=1 Tax=Edaphocola flava TaxID=2499629 RepID=UPI00100C3521|nr:hypothetical protein [Edaphocola flava]